MNVKYPISIQAELKSYIQVLCDNGKRKKAKGKKCMINNHKTHTNSSKNEELQCSYKYMSSIFSKMLEKQTVGIVDVMNKQENNVGLWWLCGLGKAEVHYQH